MERGSVQKYLDIAIKGIFWLLVAIIILSLCSIEATKKPEEEINTILAQQKIHMKKMAVGQSTNPNLPDPWPVKMNAGYPDIELIDQTGQSLRISDLKGKILIVEYIDMTSPVSQAQSGAAIVGAYGLSSEIDKFAVPFSDVIHKNLGDEFPFPRHEGIVEIKIIVYGENGGQGSRDDAQNWAMHFNLSKEDHVVVAVAQKDLRGKDVDSMIGGYQLVDKNGLLRVDSSGPMPKHNLDMTLVPLVPKLLR